MAIDKTWRTAGSIEALRDMWPELLDEIQSELDDLCEKQATGVSGTELQSQVQSWWLSVSGILRVYLRCKAQGVEISPDPVVLLEILARVAEELGNGNTPELVRDASDNRRSLWRGERFDIAYAIFYIEACKDGRISDNHYNKTVRDNYDVTAKAVRGWLKRRDDICRGVPIKGFDAARINSEMRTRGKRYAKIGRGAPSPGN